MTTAEPPQGEARIIPLARSARRAGRAAVTRPDSEPLGAGAQKPADGPARPAGGRNRPADGRGAGQPAADQPAASRDADQAAADEPADTGRRADHSAAAARAGADDDAVATPPRPIRAPAGRPRRKAGDTPVKAAATKPAAAGEPKSAPGAKSAGAKSAGAKALGAKALGPRAAGPKAAGDGSGEPSANGRSAAQRTPRGGAAKPTAGRPAKAGAGRSRSTRVAPSGEPENPEERAERLLRRPGGQLLDGLDAAAVAAVAAASATNNVADTPTAPMADAAGLERALAGMLAFLRRRITGDYEVDELGFDPDLTEHVVAPLLRPVYRNYFRVETRGLENVPDTGGALVVANHSGTLPIDALMTAVALLDHHPAHRYLRMLAADLVFSLPFLAPLARKTGNTLACQPDAERLLGKGELVGVWPEGFKGVGKPFSERYKLQRFGRGGFVSAALRTGVPIIPCTIVGAEEIYPMLGNAKTVARLLGLPYFPLTPTFPWMGVFGMLPLPSKWLIEFGEPVPTEPFTPAAADDPMLVFELTDRIRETIQHTLYGLLMQRRSVFF
jgi:1-acyl-sn-glycerol-3-phosphate acyltransferase